MNIINEKITLFIENFINNKEENFKQTKKIETSGSIKISKNKIIIYVNIFNMFDKIKSIKHRNYYYSVKSLSRNIATIRIDCKEIQNNV